MASGQLVNFRTNLHPLAVLNLHGEAPPVGIPRRIKMEPPSGARELPNAQIIAQALLINISVGYAVPGCFGQSINMIVSEKRIRTRNAVESR